MILAPRFWLPLLAALAFWPHPLAAQCLTIDPVILSQSYNPLSASDYVAAVTATVNRTPSTVAETSLKEGNFIFLRNAGSVSPDLGMEIYVTKDDGGTSIRNVLFNAPQTLKTGNNDPNEVDMNFGGRDKPSTRTFDLQFKLLAGQDLPAGDFEIPLDVSLLCEWEKGHDTLMTDPSGFRIRIKVSSALQASLVGAEFDFAEIGNLTSLAVGTAPLATVERRNYLRVASSGPYEIRIQSQNDWQMTATGTPTTKPEERIAYRFELLGQRLDSAQRTFEPSLCRRSGMGAQLIPMTATLTEGGVGKKASPTYRDTVTITVTPMAAVQESSALVCP